MPAAYGIADELHAPWISAGRRMRSKTQEDQQLTKATEVTMVHGLSQTAEYLL